MSDNARSKVEARLRKWHDDDLREATAGIDSGVLSELVRDGLRVMLGIRTKLQTEVKERPLLVPQAHSSSPTMRRTLADAQKQPSLSKPYVPNQNLGRN